ncbi:hypothetical protein H6504_02185 [Candidatus Woesearchaeota archaeon]|nr:hypothetical protein [Candidatus Woesearchaeota archaeon]
MRNDLSLAIISVLFAIAIMHILPPQALLDDRPLLNFEHIRHYWTSHMLQEQDYVVDNQIQNGLLWGVHDHGSNRLMTLAIRHSPLSSVFTYKLVFLSILIMCPILLYASCRNFGLSRKSAQIALAFLAIMYLIGDGHWNTLTILIESGSQSYFLIMFLSIFTSSLLYARKYSSAILAGIIPAGIHILSPLFLSLPIIFIWLQRKKDIKIIISSVIYAAFWIIFQLLPLLRYKDFITGASYDELPGLHALDPSLTTLLIIAVITLCILKKKYAVLCWPIVIYALFGIIDTGQHWQYFVEPLKYYYYAGLLAVIALSKPLRKIQIGLILILCIIIAVFRVTSFGYLGLDTVPDEATVELTAYLNSLPPTAIVIDDYLGRESHAPGYRPELMNLYQRMQTDHIFKGSIHPKAIYVLQNVTLGLNNGTLMWKTPDKIIHVVDISKPDAVTKLKEENISIIITTIIPDSTFYEHIHQIENMGIYKTKDKHLN